MPLEFTKTVRNNPPLKQVFKRLMAELLIIWGNMPTQRAKPGKVSGELPVGKDLLITQYAALRSEIHQRLDQRQQLLTYTLVGAASFLSIGVQPGISAVTVLCYPILAFFLSCAWGQHDNRISQINGFLQGIEDRLLPPYGIGWESYRRALWKSSRKTLADLVTLPARGLFMGSQVLAVIIGVTRYMQDPQMFLMFAFLILADAVTMILTAIVLKSRRSPHTHAQVVSSSMEERELVGSGVV